jgi:hypothetical protein
MNKIKIKKKIFMLGLGVVVHACNLSYSGGERITVQDQSWQGLKRCPI